MKRFLSLSLFATVCSYAGAASADVLSLASYGTLTNAGLPNAAPAGVANTALAYISGGAPLPTYNLPNTAPWANALGNSSWISFNPNTYPFGSVIAPNATYTYTTTFFDALPGSSSGMITVMADDTASVYLNGTLVAAAAMNSPAGNCTVGGPNCRVPTTFTLTGFVAGLNTLTFNVSQLYGVAEGLDFTGTVNTNAVPEPGSLLFMGTGLLAGAGMFLRRFRS